MTCKVQLSPLFQTDLDEIWTYIAEEYLNPEAADRITDDILDTVRALQIMPLRGRKIILPGGMDSGYRFLVFEAYVIVYRIWPGVVQVARVIPAALDYMRVMFPRVRKDPIEDEEG